MMYSVLTNSMTKPEKKQPRRITHQENCRNHLITHLRHTQLENDYLTLKLGDLINAYRPHTDANPDEWNEEKRYVSKLSFNEICDDAYKL